MPITHAKAKLALENTPPMLIALKKKQWERVKSLALLKKANSSLENFNLYYSEALLAAIRAGEINIAKLLLQQGARPNSTEFLCLAVKMGYNELIEVLLEAGAPITHADIKKTPMYLAIEMKNWPAVEKLVCGKKPNSMTSNLLCSTSYYDEALFQAALHKKTYIVKRLLELGVHINKEFENIQTKGQHSFLHEALLRKNYYLVFELIKFGVDTNVKDSNGLTPAQLASKLGYTWYEKVINAKDMNEAECHFNRWQIFHLMQNREPNQDQHNLNVGTAFSILEKLTEHALFSAEANAEVGEYTYLLCMQLGYDKLQALALAQPYFEMALSGSDDKRQYSEFYIKAMQYALYENKSNTEFDSDEFNSEILNELKREIQRPEVYRNPERDKMPFYSLIHQYRIYNDKYWEKSGKSVPMLVTHLRQLDRSTSQLQNLWTLNLIRRQAQEPIASKNRFFQFFQSKQVKKLDELRSAVRAVSLKL